MNQQKVINKTIYVIFPRYEGEWLCDQRSGYGSFHYANGDVYKGDWSQDVRHGKGEYTYTYSEMVYDGMWRHGKRSGNLPSSIMERTFDFSPL